MKKGRLFILIIAMLICIVAVGCRIFKTETKSKPETNASTVEAELESNTKKGILRHIDPEFNENSINPSIAVQYSDREFSVYSDTLCFLTINIDIYDAGSSSTCAYGPFKISAGEKMNFTIDELSTDFFSEKAKIRNIYAVNTFVYGDSSYYWLDDYREIDAGIQFKCYTDAVVLRSTKDCLVCFHFFTKDTDSKSGFADINMVELKANETKRFTLDDLAPGFYSDKAEIFSYSPLTIKAYKERK